MYRRGFRNTYQKPPIRQNGYVRHVPMAPNGMPIPPNGFYPNNQQVPPPGMGRQTVLIGPNHAPRFTKRDFLEFARNTLPIQTLVGIEDMPQEFRHVCPRLQPQQNPVRLLPQMHFPHPMFHEVPYYYCEICQKFIYSWLA
jgi:hypothetical protein